MANVSLALPALQPCNQTVSPIFKKTSVGLGYVSYSCSLNCPNGSCAAAGSDGLKYVAFIVDGAAATLRFNDVDQDILFALDGGGATKYAGEIPDNAMMSNWVPLVNHLRDASHSKYMKVVEIRFEAGLPAAQGWFARKSSVPSNLQIVSSRIASIIKWIAANLQGKGKKLATAGCSGGAVGTGAAQIWHGLNQLLDYQLFVGGPWLYSVPRGCGAENSNYAGWEWGQGGVNSLLVQSMVDSVHKKALTCTSNKSDSEFLNSGFGTSTNHNFTATHAIDFIINTGLGNGSDEDLGLRPHTEAVRDAFVAAGASTTTSTIEGAHCDPSSLFLWCEKIRAGMGYSGNDFDCKL